MTRHIQLAREDGPKAGFTAYMASHVPTAQARRDEIKAAGNKKAQFNAYCAIFGEQFKVKPATRSSSLHSRIQREEVIENGAEEESFLDKLARTLGVKPSVLSKLADPNTHDPADDEEWNEDEAHGVQVEAPAPYAPKNGNGAKHSTSGRLWKLNELGLLQIRTKQGTPITNDKAHEAISENLS